MPLTSWHYIVDSLTLICLAKINNEFAIKISFASSEMHFALKIVPETLF